MVIILRMLLLLGYVMLLFFLFKHIDNILMEKKILNIIFKAPIT